MISSSLVDMPSSHNGPLLPRAAAVAIKRQQQAADDGVPPPSHNARVQLHRDEYANRGIDGAYDSRLIIFVRHPNAASARRTSVEGRK